MRPKLLLMSFEAITLMLHHPDAPQVVITAMLIVLSAKLEQWRRRKGRVSQHSIYK